MARAAKPRPPLSDNQRKALAAIDELRPGIPPWTIPGETWQTEGQFDRRMLHNTRVQALVARLLDDCGARLADAGRLFRVGDLSVSSTQGTLAAIDAWAERARERLAEAAAQAEPAPAMENVAAAGAP